MCLSVFLAQVIGCYLFLVSLAMLVHQQRFRKLMHDFLSHPTIVEICSTICVAIGLLIVISHNIWVQEWPVVVTLIGWIILLQGLMRLFLPELFVKLMKDILGKLPYLILSWVRLIIGLYLIWAGFSQG